MGITAVGGVIGPNGFPINAWNPVTPNLRVDPIILNAPSPAPNPAPVPMYIMGNELSRSRVLFGEQLAVLEWSCFLLNDEVHLWILKPHIF